MTDMHDTHKLLLRGLAIFLVLVAVGGALSLRPGAAIANNDAAPYTGTVAMRELSRLHQSLDEARGELEVTQMELKRTQAILSYSSRYGISPQLTSLIYDTALREGLDPDLAFRLVHIESDFRPTARSRAGAIGLTQVMPRTALYYDASATTAALETPAVNLRVGFRYLRDLLQRFDGDVRLALLAYNRGPVRVEELLAQGRDPRNGYASSVISGDRRPGPALP